MDLITVDIERFVRTRKAAGLSQSALAKGICTQATLSKFENRGIIPSIKILTKLCNRLGITLNDLLPLGKDLIQDSEKQLNEAEYQLITEDYQRAQNLLTKINPTRLADKNAQMHYYFIAGYISALTEGPISETLYLFSQILVALDSEHETIFSLLAYTGTGIAYSRLNDIPKATFYFDQVPHHLDHINLTDFKMVWRAINMLYYASRFYQQQKDYAASSSLASYGVQIAQDSHVTFYLAQLKFLLAQNARALKQPAAEIRTLLTEAQVIAKFNRNPKLLLKISRF